MINKALAKSLSKSGAGLLAHLILIYFIYASLDFVVVVLVIMYTYHLGINGNYELMKPYYQFILNTFFAVFFGSIIATIIASPIYRDAKFGKNTLAKGRFSTLKEVLNYGLNGNGIVFGKIGKNLISKPQNVEGHVLVVGGTGTGKSRGVAIPSLLKWQGSAVVIDIKGELSRITENRRLQYGKTYIFKPESKECACYDPIALCNDLDQAQDLARTIIPLPEKGELFWCQSAQAILSAFVFEGAIKGYKLTDIAERLCITPIKELVEHCRQSEIREVRMLASIAYDLPEKTLGGVMGELKAKLITLATDENIRRATQRSDWTPEALEKGDTIYLNISEHLLEQYKDVLTVIINQILKYLSKREEKKNPPILIVLDELARLSKVNGLVNALSTLRSRNVHIMNIIQSMAQLDFVYSEDERKIIADNCKFKLVLSATDPETQKYFSDLSGQQTVLGGTFSGKVIVSESKSEQVIPLIRPEDFANLKRPILLASGLYPMQLDLAFWDIEKF